MRGNRPWWAKGLVSWGARWKTSTRISVVLVILWLLLINATKFTHSRHNLRVKNWIWWWRHTHLYHWWISVNSGSWYHRWIRSLFLFRDHVSQESAFPLSMRLPSMMWWRCLTISCMSSWALICGCLSKMSRFFQYPPIIAWNLKRALLPWYAHHKGYRCKEPFWLYHWHNY